MSNEILRFSQIAAITKLKRHTVNARAKSLFKESELKRSQGNQILLKPKQIRRLIDDRLNPLDGKIVYIGNLKGGVGKTTLAYLIANTASLLGIRTCAIDLDVQANLTSEFLSIDCDQSIFYDVIEGSCKINDVIVPVSENLDLIPSSLRNSLIQKALTMQAPKHHLSWFNSLCLDYLRNNYDLIIVDTPPHLTTLNSVFCLCLTETDNIIIPACADGFSAMGVEMFLDDITTIRNSYRVKEEPKISIVINRFFQNQKTNLEMLVSMGQEYGPKLSETIIRDSAKIRELINNKVSLGDLKQGKEVYELLSNLLEELQILKLQEAS